MNSIKIIKASEMDATAPTHNFVIIGESGSGKSHSLMTFPKGWKVLVLDMFGNKETYAGDPDIEVIPFSDLDPSSPTAWPSILSVKKDLVSMLEQKTFKWNVLVVDTVTGLTRFAENFIVGTNPTGRGIGGAAAQQHYRGISHICGQFFTSFLGFPIVNVLICHVSPPYDEGQVANKALITGTVWRNSLYSYVHECYRSFGQSYKEEIVSGDGKKRVEERTQYVWQTQVDREWPMLKSVLSRGGKFFGKFVEPNFSKIFARRGLIGEDLIKEPIL